ncbi:glycoside hydrolase [bacterium (Candidatus Blackallbacteria) CG17_big_fil_post_rev_8_21_14_2_50_48_46]|uniref:Glycoside hydrolase n=1 Tax=bacterium (Candidatus Blackallbacteria) CG17_big_fil_post_rev_8_21_14_2_50_48_46 TaxID=2014261 RepID=A0A2M7FXB0_9BACT|nr:MAG: glycoside hydrolase [bacterium (Candidatus Blackallbacteria) CG18_big_fil_WC_8_21_14_2_50_49_26]PIW13775.1 MAG: glycoside hydrolase [bacterium (Candidatus Blackallbacteria) CG17_big_fil_post_rev_8_21_14_2_50_48_46]PIW45001.1 MAG: glycoside hydrolase [bacterium (Candidatus Blackallbacteria) CG13_big_fil_rev_8_21_14_2_50_49_14]
MQPLYIAFIWHMHQPLYRDPESQYYMMPWVRLHGVKDYLDMATILENYPRIRQTFNLVPSLLEQLQDYADGNAEDRYLNLSRIPVAELSNDEKEEILHNFFDLNWDQMVRPYPRYLELAEKRTTLFHHYQNYYQVAEHFSDQEFMDLTVWFNLAWIDPVVRRQRPELRALEEKGQGFSSEERKTLLAAHQSLIQEIFPTYKRLQASGQIELTTSPYYHPILPLLTDSTSALEARPHLRLPEQHYLHPEDAIAQLHKGRDFFTHCFGQTPRGVWPSEQSLSPEIVARIAEEGFSWAASSEGILWHTLGVQPHRNSQHILNLSEYLYRPYQVQVEGQALNLVFRDIFISDQIGFNCWKGDNERNAHHLYQHIKGIQTNLSQKEPYPYLLTIALDGENCWEYYHEDGHHFLNTLYSLLEKDQSLECVTVSDYLDRFPPQQALDTLHSGSWIGSDFRTWIGDPTKNLAWDFLKTTRDFLVQNQDSIDPETRAKAWECIYIAEGSDWFWWFGEGHNSAHDHLFDAAFRRYLEEVYLLLEQEVPEWLQIPVENQIDNPAPQLRHLSTPISTMQPANEYYHS